VARDAGLVEMRAGEPVAAEREARVGYEILDRIGDLGHLASAVPDLGEAVYAQGRYDEAFELAELNQRITIKGDVDAEVRGGQLMAKALARRGEFDKAGALAADAVRLMADTDYVELQANTLMSQAEVLSLAGRKADAAASVREAIELYARKGNVVTQARAAGLLKELES
jgi:tetratricopeptide (TPR) repeat protein